MEKFEWSPTFEIGVSEIDDGHRLLFTLAQQVSEAVEEGDHEACRSLVDSFFKATESHFAAEERFLASRRYHGLDAHKKYHASLLAKAGRLKQASDNATERGQATESYLEVVGFLIDDILRGDMSLKS
ncbi:MAG: hemerythrin domain-containing protein, partial [Alphaproteobacteria bacterium]